MIVEIVQAALERLAAETFPSVQSREATLDYIKGVVDTMSGQLRNLATQGAPTYDTAAQQFAYVQRYVTVRAQLVCDLLGQIQGWGFGPLQVTSLGAGPGTDLLGVLKGTPS